jgi:predicted regulator of Ras-like GTPase activity (Roadblock/LC7/MglB family)
MAQSTFEKILEDMNKQGSFSATVLAGDDGLPIAADPQPSPYDADTIAAMVTMVRSFIKDTQTRLKLAEVDEVAIMVGDRSRLVCRYFTAADRVFVLTTITQPHQTYRRLMTQAIHAIKIEFDS